MRQEIQVNLTITIDADIKLSKEDIKQILEEKYELAVLLGSTPYIPNLSYMEHKINTVKEEAEIYENE